MAFAEWMNRVADVVMMSVGCSIDIYNLPDCLFRDWYEDGVTLEEAAGRAIEEA